MERGISEKSMIRKEALERRAAMPAAVRAEADRAIRERLFRLPAYAKAERILLYISVGTEVDTRRIAVDALAAGKKVYCPYCEKRPVITDPETGVKRKGAGVMHFYRVTKIDALRVSTYGIPEPDPERAEPFPGPDTGVLMLMPGTAFDPHCGRIGYGGGYYDRYLAEHPGIPTIALAYECQLTDHVPMLPGDIAPEAILTELRWIRKDKI